MTSVWSISTPPAMSNELDQALMPALTHRIDLTVQALRIQWLSVLSYGHLLELVYEDVLIVSPHHLQVEDDLDTVNVFHNVILRDLRLGDRSFWNARRIHVNLALVPEKAPLKKEFASSWPSYIVVVDRLP